MICLMNTDIKKPFRFFAIFLLSACCLVPAAQAQHFFLDTGFAHTGIDTFQGNIATGIIHRPVFVLPQLDNKIVLVGSIYYATSVEVMRLNYDGTFDSTFNDSGKVVATHGYIQTPPSAATLYDTSKIITASQWLDISTGWEYMSVFNFNSNGSLNTSFGTGGVAMVGLTTSLVYSYPYACGVQSDGKIVIMGGTSINGIETYGLTRLQPNGSVDASYGSAGIEIDPYQMLDTPIGSSPNEASAICGYMQHDNKFVVVGRFTDSGSIYNAYQCFIVRHDTDGSPDMSFGEANGITLIKAPNQDYEANAVAADSMGNSYVLAHIARWTPPFSDSNFAVIKVDQNGHRVSTYGYNGVSYLQLPVANAGSYAFAVQKDGRAIISNIYHDYTNGFTDKFIVYRLDTAGNLDTSFNTGGQIITQRDTNRHDLCIAAAIEPDGKILLAGYDTLSATGICMRFTNQHDTIATVVHNILSSASPAFTGYVFPNPALGKISVHYTNTGQPGTGSLMLYDINGRLMDCQTESLSGGSGEITYNAPSGIAGGMYYIVLQNSNGEKQVHPVTLVK